ncbi:hypothetical protein PaecuDRAFT_1725 [Paenibacillus curdlanolyticus YK9]|uniref:Uncharacterized protein n=1 Tax=Paenibacillus curdlanolyticus YK9 TaxID=717606 RepID=E0I7X4_9BACL|nr:hypothetical protein PaecuDRAFT_1725 [Paenibacillus curdlanolyticus YK9]
MCVVFKVTLVRTTGCSLQFIQSNQMRAQQLDGVIANRATGQGCFLCFGHNAPLPDLSRCMNCNGSLWSKPSPPFPMYKVQRHGNKLSSYLETYKMPQPLLPLKNQNKPTAPTPTGAGCRPAQFYIDLRSISISVSPAPPRLMLSIRYLFLLTTNVTLPSPRPPMSANAQGPNPSKPRICLRRLPRRPARTGCRI